MEYRGYLEVGGSTSSTILPIASFSVSEQYNSGWTGKALMALTPASVKTGEDDEEATEPDPLTTGVVFGVALNAQIMPGTPVILHLALWQEATTEDTTTTTTTTTPPPANPPPSNAASGDDPPEEGAAIEGVILRAWPSVVVGVEPEAAADGQSGTIRLDLADPVSYLAGRPVFGAFRAVSAAEIIGGALSLAAGGDGIPTLEPVLPGMPRCLIKADYRDALDELPYAVASGQLLGDWLDETLGLVGLRMEIFGGANGVVTITLSDRETGGEAVPVGVIGTKESAEEDAETISGDITASNIEVSMIDALPGQTSRGAVVDDPVLGSFRRLAPLGAVGSVHAGGGIGLDEAGKRASFPVLTAEAEMLMLRIRSRQPACRPGRNLSLNTTFFGISSWQVAQATHWKVGDTYENVASLMPTNTPWHPPRPTPRPARVVSGMVDGGTDKYNFHEPVPRDRLGRIPISLSFVPTPSGTRAAMIALFDEDQSGRVTLADFKDSAQDFEDRKAFWDEQEKNLEAGEYDEPFPGQDDDDLTEDEKKERADMLAKREAAFKYVAYKWARDRDAKDKDRDGYISLRDTAMSTELQAIVADPAARAEIDKQWRAYEAGNLEEVYPDEAERQAVLARLPLLREYGALFGDGTGPDSDKDLGLTTEQKADAAEARHDADMADERWPPRIPLSIIEPIAGSLHGFIPAHRHGDICRVAVHHPLHAEVLGFQYRSDRQINANLLGSTAGLVIEHAASAWSGMVFRPTEELEGEGTAD